MADAIVLLGLRDEGHLSRKAREFGWSAEAARDLDELRRIVARCSVVAVYFDPRSMDMSWQRALGSVMRAAPSAYPVICQHFSDRVSVDEMTAQGAFYVLHVPFAHHEVLQSLGFLQSAAKRKLAARAQEPVVLRKAAAKAS